MLLDSVRRLLGRHQPPASVPYPAVEPPRPASVTTLDLADCDDLVWPSSRIGVVEALWGEGFLFAGGRAEALRLAKPLGLAVTGVLRRLGFDVRIAEDVSRRKMREAMDGWRLAVQAMAETRPAPRAIAAVLREAELWLARFRLLRAGKLRLVRWNALASGRGV